MRAILRYFAIKALSEQVDPQKKGFLQNRFVEDSLARYNFALRYVKNKMVMDIACGEGYGSHLLSKTAKKVIGVDVASDVIKHAREKYCDNSTTLEFVCADAMDFLAKTERRFDVIVSFETVEHIKDYVRFITLFKKCLKTGGVLILSTPNRKFTDLFYGKPFNPYHLKEFYTQELAGILTQIFHTQPEIYRQRPVSKKNLFLSTFQAFVLHGKSIIIRNNPSITSLDNIFVIIKK